jgi:uncharacterized repeat protein (TIGR01451 family)
MIVNTAEISSPTDIDHSNNVVTVTTDVHMPDMAVSKSGPAEATSGQAITYTISWANQGTIPAPMPRITDTLPLGVQYVADNSGFAQTQPSTGVLVWSVTPDPVPVGMQGTFVLTAWVTTAQGITGPLVNQVEVGSDLPDGDLTNSQGSWSTNLLLRIYLPLVYKGYAPP